MTTANMARDMDQIRQAFGVKQITYYGFSYGTYLGQVYGTLFPGQVRRMVLDSTVDPTGAWYADNISQDYAFQGRLEAFFAWTAKYDSAYHLGSTAAQVQAAYYKIRAKLEKIADRRAERPADRPGRARRHDPHRRVPERRVARVRAGALAVPQRSGSSSRPRHPVPAVGHARTRTRSRSTTRSSAPT